MEILARFAAVAASVLAILANNGAVVAQEACSASPAVMLEGVSSVPGYPQGPFIFTERLLLVKASGVGLEGDWFGTHYEQIATYPFLLDDLTIAAILSVPPTEIAGVGAVCAVDVAGPSSVRTRCEGGFDFEVHGGRVFWAGQSTPVGTLDNRRLTIRLTPNPDIEPMTGVVPEGAVPGLRAEATEVSILQTYATIGVRVALEPPISGVAETLAAEARHGGASSAVTWTVDNTGGGVATVTLRLEGIRSRRTALVGEVTVTASVRLDDCTYTQTWPLDELLLVSGLRM